MAERQKKAAAESVKKNLLIVESPAKAKTIKNYLGDTFEVLSSKGHVRDLPASRLGVDIENGFKPEYILVRKDNRPSVVKALKDAAAKCDKIYLATDPDREGEAIAWHLASILSLDPEDKIRVSFDEITKKTVTESIAKPRSIDLDLVNAQQTRRVLDRIVGYKLSPFLWKKVKKGLSAGRVQSVATRMVVDREREINAFVPKEYWSLDAVFPNGEKTFKARFYGTKTKKTELCNKEQTEALIERLKDAEYVINEIKTAEKPKRPKPPFTTSSLQQDASARLNMRPSKTMSVAQTLYEGVNIKGVGLTGLITYMRTDSLRISAEARAAAKALITDKYGSQFYPSSPHVYKSNQAAQDAHEAIRPSHVELTPEDVKDSLTPEQYRLYKLIWIRFIASQMSNAVYTARAVDIEANGYIFKANDSKLKFKGFTVLYDYSDAEEENMGKMPSSLEEGQRLELKELVSEQKFTQPPLRYTEATLIRAMEENGIGRPSTYAPTINTIIEKAYVEREGRALKPTQIGEITTDIMLESFHNIVDISFTSDMEQQLDKVGHGERTYLDVMQTFYRYFSKTLKVAEEKTEKVKVEVKYEESDVVCELCGAKMIYREGKYGKFLACPNFPKCKNTKAITVYADGACPKCGGRMIKKTAKGKTFFACENRESCGFMTWDTPVNEICPNCGKPLFKQYKTKTVCLNEGCGYTKTEGRSK